MNKIDEVLKSLEDDLKEIPVNSDWKPIEQTPLAKKVFAMEKKAKEAEAVVIEEAMKQLQGLAVLAQHYLPQGVKITIPDLENSNAVKR